MASAELLDVQTSFLDYWSPCLMAESGIVGVTLVVVVVVVVEIAVAVADEASSSEVANSLMDVVVELVFVVVAAAVDSCVVCKRQDNFGS